MTIPAAADGHGLTLTMSGFVAHIVSVDGPGFARDAIDKTHMGSTNYKESMPAKLADPGELSVELEFDPAAVPPILDAPTTVAIAWGSTVATTWTWTNSYMTAFKVTGGKSGERMMASATIKLNGAPTIS